MEVSVRYSEDGVNDLRDVKFRVKLGELASAGQPSDVAIVGYVLTGGYSEALWERQELALAFVTSVHLSDGAAYRGSIPTYLGI